MKLVEAIMATAELCGTRLSENAGQMLVDDLMQYPEPLILGALARCRRELKGRLTVSEILLRIDDGRPGPDESWAMLPWDEEETAVLTEEMQEAQGAAWHAYNAGDKIGARLAFRDAYTRIVSAARSSNKPARWVATLGWDKDRRYGPILEAQQKGRLAAGEVQLLLPEYEASDRKAIEGPRSESVQKAIREVAEAIKMPKPSSE